MVGNQLSKVLIAGDHERKETVFLCHDRERAYYVVGLKPGDFKSGDAPCFQYALDVGHGNLDTLGSLLPLRLVLWVFLVSECASRRVEANGNV